MKLRRPTDDSVAGCVWLARILDKARCHLAGTLHPDFVTPFCHPIATDGAFLTHFALSKDELLAAVREAGPDDVHIARWFLARAASAADRIAAWNTLAPHIGKPGYPMERGFRFMVRQLYGGTPPDPRIVGAFTAIAYDEGYLDEMVPPAA
jgi:hypothetical protein